MREDKLLSPCQLQAAVVDLRLQTNIRREPRMSILYFQRYAFVAKSGLMTWHSALCWRSASFLIMRFGRSSACSNLLLRTSSVDSSSGQGFPKKFGEGTSAVVCTVLVFQHQETLLGSPISCLLSGLLCVCAVCAHVLVCVNTSVLRARI